MNENFSVPSEPIVTVIIPVYNIEKTIKRTILSIQNQNLKEIEILLIDDCSMDNSVNIISELQKFDNRIKLLKNKKNKGTLYTRSIGAINAKSKYIITINNYDLFIGDIFNICNEENRLNNIDIIEFSGYNSFISITSNYSLIKQPYYINQSDTILNKSELSNILYKEQNISSSYVDYIIKRKIVWAKWIKAEVYKKALDILGEVIFDENICWGEERIINYALFKSSDSYKYINNKGLIHLINYTTINEIDISGTKKNEIIFNEFNYIMKIFNITKIIKDDKLLTYEIKNALKLPLKNDANQKNKIFITNLFNDIIKSGDVSSRTKEEISSMIKILFNKDKEILQYHTNIFE
jgi:glycosyltransferase involved in cell wall biosynthesis